MAISRRKLLLEPGFKLSTFRLSQQWIRPLFKEPLASSHPLAFPKLVATPLLDLLGCQNIFGDDPNPPRACTSSREATTNS